MREELAEKATIAFADWRWFSEDRGNRRTQIGTTTKPPYIAVRKDRLRDVIFVASSFVANYTSPEDAIVTASRRSVAYCRASQSTQQKSLTEPQRCRKFGRLKDWKEHFQASWKPIYRPLDPSRCGVDAVFLLGMICWMQLLHIYETHKAVFH